MAIYDLMVRDLRGTLSWFTVASPDAGQFDRRSASICYPLRDFRIILSDQGPRTRSSAGIKHLRQAMNLFDEPQICMTMNWRLASTLIRPRRL